MVKSETAMDKGSIENSTKISEPLITIPNPRAFQREQSVTVPTPSVSDQSKYVQLLNVIEEFGRDIRPSYAGSRSSAERIKRGLTHARILVKECIIEAEKSARQ